MRNWFYSLDLRERQIVSVGLLFLLMIGIYLFIIEPTDKTIALASHRVMAREAEYVQLQRLTHAYRELDRINKKATPRLDQSLLSLIDQGGQKAGIKGAIKRLTPEGDKKVRVHFENAEFNRVVGWLITNYQQQGISVEALNIRNTEEPGVISGTVMLTR